MKRILLVLFLMQFLFINSSSVMANSKPLEGLNPPVNEYKDLMSTSMNRCNDLMNRPANKFSELLNKPVNDFSEPLNTPVNEFCEPKNILNEPFDADDTQKP